jgi:hypothetical protein
MITIRFVEDQPLNDDKHLHTTEEAEHEGSEIATMTLHSALQRSSEEVKVASRVCWFSRPSQWTALAGTDR